LERENVKFAFSRKDSFSISKKNQNRKKKLARFLFFAQGSSILHESEDGVKFVHGFKI
jgi:hypothetical protein